MPDSAPTTKPVDEGWGDIGRALSAAQSRHSQAAFDAEDTASPGGYHLTVNVPIKGIPRVSKNDIHAAAQAVAHFRAHHAKKHEEAKADLAKWQGKHKEALTQHRMFKNTPGLAASDALAAVKVADHHIKRLTMAVDRTRVEHERAKTKDIHTLPTEKGVAFGGAKHVFAGKEHLLKSVERVRSAAKALAPHAQALLHTAKMYGGEGASHPDAANLVDPKAPHAHLYNVLPHTKRGVHGFTFHFKKKSEAWRMGTSVKLDRKPFHSIKAHDDQGKEQFSLHPNESAEGDQMLDVLDEALNRKDGSLRDLTGKFRSLEHKGPTAFVANIPKAFRIRVEELGGKVKPSGNAGGLALLFKTGEAAQAALGALVGEGHRVQPHDIPGILLCSFVKPSAEQPVHEGISSHGEGTVAVHFHVAPEHDHGPTSSTYEQFRKHAVEHGAAYVGGNMDKRTLVAHFWKMPHHDSVHEPAMQAMNLVQTLKKKMGDHGSKVRLHYVVGDMNEAATASYEAGKTHLYLHRDGDAHVMHTVKDGRLVERRVLHGRIVRGQQPPGDIAPGTLERLKAILVDEAAMPDVEIKLERDGDKFVLAHYDTKGALIEKRDLPKRIAGAPSQRDAMKMVRDLGGSAEPLHRTGEIKVSHPAWNHVVVTSAHRRDASKHLVRNINDLLARHHALKGGAQINAMAGQTEDVVEQEFEVDVVLPEDLHGVFDDAVEATNEAVEAAKEADCAFAVVSRMNEGVEEFVVMPWDDALIENELLLAAFPCGATDNGGVNDLSEGVARRRRLAARLSAGRIRGRPMGGARHKTAMRAKRWRLRHRGKHLLNKKTTVYRNQASL